MPWTRTPVQDWEKKKGGADEKRRPKMHRRRDMSGDWAAGTLDEVRKRGDPQGAELETAQDVDTARFARNTSIASLFHLQRGGGVDDSRCCSVRKPCPTSRCDQPELLEMTSVG